MTLIASVLWGSTAMAVIAPESTAILIQAQKLGIESETEKAYADLEKIPRAKLVSAFRDGLKDPSWSMITLNAVSALKVEELALDLGDLAKTRDDWMLIATLGSIAPETERSKLAQILISRLSKVSNPTRVASLETLGAWHQQISKSDYEKYLKDESFEVRVAAVRAFVGSRTSLKAADQLSRYQQAFAAEPYTVRLEALNNFASLSSSEQTQLIGALDSRFKKACGQEKNPQVKSKCDQLISRLASVKSAENAAEKSGGSK